MAWIISPQIDHAEIEVFASERVNLPADDAKEYRAQVKTLTDRLEYYINEHPGFDFVRSFHSGSVAKGTALRNISDMDLAIYVREGNAPKEAKDLILWMIARLKEAYPTMKPEQFVAQPYSVKVSFRGTGLDVDVVPVLYSGAKDWIGVLVDRNTGVRLTTSIPRHLEFIKSRKENNPKDFAQVVRLIKWWVNIRKEQSETFKFKSLMVEMLIAHLADSGIPLSNYRESLEQVFKYLVQSRLQHAIWFSDYYTSDALQENDNSAIKFYDPVNPKNNVAGAYTTRDRDEIVQAAQEAFDAIVYARTATTKAIAIDCWKKVLGPGMGGV